jgi:predicted permease
VRISTEFGRLSHAQALGLQEDLLARVKALPGVRNASLSYACDLPGCGQQVSLAAPGGSLTVPARLGTVSHGFFETTGLTLARGRGFTPVDRANAPRVAVINETLAGQLFPGGEAVGRRFRLDGPGLALPGQPRELEVVGVIKDARVFGPRRISPTPLAFVPAAQSPKFVGQLEVRTFGDPAALAERVRRTVLEVNPHLPVRNLRSMRTQLDRELTGERLVATLSSAFGAAALLLVCVGLYGVIAQWALQRTREIGVRMALGATTAGVRWLVLRQALAMVGVGVALGIPAALGAAQGFRRFLYGLSPTDPATVAAAVAVMFAIAAAAAYLPARRASRVDPMQALRGE